jgi:sulfate permease, SulP family
MKDDMKSTSRAERMVPALSWLRRYRSSWLGRDLVAGLVVWALVVPEAMAYAGIAGVPVQFGLYSVPLAVLAYMLLGTSRHLFDGPSSTVAIMAAATVAPLAAAQSEHYVVLMAVLSLLIGALYVMLGLLRMGFIARFFAKPVLDGFIIGLGIYIAVNQLPKIVGVEKGSGNTVRQLGHVFSEVGSWNWPTVAVGATGLAALFVLGHVAPRVPGALVAAVLGIVVVTAFDLTTHHVEVVGAVPEGFHFVPWSGVSWDEVLEMLPGALGIIVVGYAQSIAVAKSYAAKFDYTIDPNQELIAYGAASLGAGALQGYTPTGSLSKTAASVEAGGKSPLVLLFCAAFVTVTVLLFTAIFENLPEAMLGAIVVHAVFGMIDVSKLTRLYRAHIPDFWLAVGALGGVIVFDILPGIVIGVVLSLALLLHRVDHPHAALLGRSPDGTRYADLAQNPDFAPVPHVLIYRLDAPLIFANADVVIDDIQSRVRAAESPLRAVVVDCESVPEIDTTGTDALAHLDATLASRGVELLLAQAHYAVRDYLERGGGLALLVRERSFPTVDAAIDALSAGDYRPDDTNHPPSTSGGG